MLVLTLKIGSSVYIGNHVVEFLDFDCEGNLHVWSDENHSDFYELKLFGRVCIAKVEIQLIGYDRGYVRVGFTGDKSIPIHREKARAKYV